MSANVRPGDVVTVGAGGARCRVVSFRLRPGGLVASVRPVGGGRVVMVGVGSLRREKVAS